MSVDLSILSTSQLVELYNLIADKPVKSFRDKTTAVRRFAATLESSGYEVFEAEPGDYDVRVSSTEVDPTEDATVERKAGGRRSPLLGRKLKLLRVENPKRKNSRTFARYSFYADVKTSTEYMDLCLAHGLGSRREILSDLAWDSKQNFIRLS